MKLESCKDIHSFLAMAGYYRKYIKVYARNAAPLTTLTREKSYYKWGIEEQTSEQPIKTLAPAEKAWSPQEKEALGIIWGCETCRPYILSAHFTVETDHES